MQYVWFADDMGYTAEELRILEARKLELLLNPNPQVFQVPEFTDFKIQATKHTDTSDGSTNG